MLHELSETGFHATFAAPMQLLGSSAACCPLVLDDYVAECIAHYKLPTSLEDIQIEQVYLTGDRRHTHVQFHYGVPNLYLVVVVSHDFDAIIGHRFLDLSRSLA